MIKRVKQALSNLDIIVSNVQMKRNEHDRLREDLQVVAEQCEKAAKVKKGKKE